MSGIGVVADFGNLCGESPIWDASNDTLYWTDQTAHRLYRRHAGRAELMRDGLEANAIRQDRAGGFVLANNHGVWAWDGKGCPCLLFSEAEGHQLRVNDCTADPAGRLLAGTCFYDPSGRYERGKLVRIERGRRPAILDEGFELANGLGFSPDQRTLYFADSAARRIYAYDYDIATGTARNRRAWVSVPAEEGLPDGLAVDAAGFVWSAQWYGGAVVRYDPDGTVERRLHVPAKQTSSLCFGGAALMEIFITSAAQSEPMPVMPPGYDATHGPFGGQLFHVNAGVPGKAELRTAL